MTTLADTAPLAPSHDGRHRPDFSLLVAWLIALGLIAAQIAPLATATFRDGILFDNDDAMRLVQFREWMGGQGWTDLTQHRVDPPDSPVSHWSRLVELPISGIVMPLRPIIGPATSERIAVTFWPCVLLAGFVFGLLAMARRLFGPPAVIAGALIVALNPVLLFQFLPGRIDHHGVQMTLALCLTALAARALFRPCVRAAVAAGCVSALMLAIGLETLPLVAAVAAAFGLTWIIRGEQSRRPVAAFGATLALATLVAFSLTVPPSRWLLPTVDSLSLPWLWLAVGGGLALFCLARTRTVLQWRRRAVLAFSVAAAISALFSIVWPACLAGPYGSLDPLARELWLAGVGEAQPLPLLVLRNPAQFLFFLVFPLVGWLALGGAALRERDEPRFVLLFGLATVALAVTIDQMRATPFASMFALLGWLYLIDRALTAGAAGRSRAIGIAAAAVIFVAALPYGWDAAGEALVPQDSTARPSCANPSDMSALIEEPPGLVLASMRLGPRILAATRHDILAAPYHRNNSGNRFALAALSGDAATALAMIRERGVDYVAVCMGDPDLVRLNSRGDSFANQLVNDEGPAWLQPLRQVGPIRAWRVAEP